MSTNLYTRSSARIDCAWFAFMAGVMFAGFSATTGLFFIHDEILIKALSAGGAIGFLYFFEGACRSCLAMWRFLRG